MSQINDPNSFSPEHAIDTSNLHETVGFAKEGCVVAMQIHLGQSVSNEPVLAHFLITEKEVEEYKGEAFVDLIIRKAAHLKEAIKQYKKSQTN